MAPVITATREPKPKIQTMPAIRETMARALVPGDR
jgi:hypothetical protein